MTTGLKEEIMIRQAMAAMITAGLTDEAMLKGQTRNKGIMTTVQGIWKGAETFSIVAVTMEMISKGKWKGNSKWKDSKASRDKWKGNNKWKDSKVSKDKWNGNNKWKDSRASKDKWRGNSQWKDSKVNNDNLKDNNLSSNLSNLRSRIVGAEEMIVNDAGVVMIMVGEDEA